MTHYTHMLWSYQQLMCNSVPNKRPSYLILHPPLNNENNLLRPVVYLIL